MSTLSSTFLDSESSSASLAFLEMATRGAASLDFEDTSSAQVDDRRKSMQSLGEHLLAQQGLSSSQNPPNLPSTLPTSPLTLASTPVPTPVTSSGPTPTLPTLWNLPLDISEKILIPQGRMLQTPLDVTAISLSLACVDASQLVPGNWVPYFATATEGDWQSVSFGAIFQIINVSSPEQVVLVCVIQFPGPTHSFQSGSLYLLNSSLIHELMVYVFNYNIHFILPANVMSRAMAMVGVSFVPYQEQSKTSILAATVPAAVSTVFTQSHSSEIARRLTYNSLLRGMNNDLDMLKLLIGPALDPRLMIPFIRNRIPILKRNLPAFSDKNILHFVSDNLGPGEPTVDKDGTISHFHLLALQPFNSAGDHPWLSPISSVQELTAAIKTWILCKGALTGDKSLYQDIMASILDGLESAGPWGLHTISLDYVCHLLTSKMVELSALFRCAELLPLGKDQFLVLCQHLMIIDPDVAHSEVLKLGTNSSINL